MNYSIITPTKNEGKYIESTIRSVISQKILPLEWFIMDDGSTDDTSRIVTQYLKGHPFIKYIQLDAFRSELKNRGGRVAAIFNYADSLRTQPADIIAKIDADTSFDPDFFSNMLQAFEKDPSLGIASGHMIENGIPEEITDRQDGRGATLLIRYSCFAEIGQLFESKTRGEDAMAYIAARARNWKTQTLDYFFHHLKPIGSRNSRLKNHFETGYYKGTIPYWFPFFLGTMLRDVFLKPYFLGALVQFYAYCVSRFIKRYRPFPPYVSEKLQSEQKIQFKKMLGLVK